MGEGNPIAPPLVLWLAVVVPLVAALIVLGRMGLSMTVVLVVVSILKFVGDSSWDLFLGAFALFLALLCASVAVLKQPSAR